ncbi:armadillo-type protein [Pavlovales sp. CCMP2436]|nr:armadillo-type protein [Pavlovales sp. CCMP2436]
MPPHHPSLEGSLLRRESEVVLARHSPFGAPAPHSEAVADLPPHATLAAVDALLARHPDAIESRPNKLLAALGEFVAANEKPATSPNFATGAADDVRAIAPLLRAALDGNSEVHERLCEMLLRAFKILSRKVPNRLPLGSRTLPAICAALASPPSERAASEAANTLLNVCYEADCVAQALRHGALSPLVSMLASARPELQATAAGAIQSIAYQKAGREAANDAGAAELLVPLLDDTEPHVAARAVGAVHNLSSDVRAIGPLREVGAIAPLVRLLRANAAGPCASAAGALQNLAREPLARAELQRLGAAVPLTDLLYANDEGCRHCAVGALLNLIGPDLGEETDANATRVLFKRVLGMAVALGELHARTAPNAPGDVSWLPTKPGGGACSARVTAAAALPGRPSEAARPGAT